MFAGGLRRPDLSSLKVCGGSLTSPVGKGLHSISSWFKVGLGWLLNAYSSHSIHNAKEVGHKAQKGHFPGCKGVGSRDAR